MDSENCILPGADFSSLAVLVADDANHEPSQAGMLLGLFPSSASSIHLISGIFHSPHVLARGRGRQSSTRVARRAALRKAAAKRPKAFRIRRRLTRCFHLRRRFSLPNPRRRGGMLLFCSVASALRALTCFFLFLLRSWHVLHLSRRSRGERIPSHPPSSFTRRVLHS